MSTSRKIMIGAGAFVLAVLIAKFFILDRSPVPAETTDKFDLAEIRKTAEGGGKPLPESLHVLVIAEGAFPASGVVAGEGLFKKFGMVFDSFQVNYADKKTVIIDSAFDEVAHKKMAKDAPFYLERYAAMHSAMERATAIVFTHEHPDHLGGVAQSTSPEKLKSRLVMPKEQIEDPYRAPDMFNPAAAAMLKEVKPIEYTKYYLVSPGVLLIRAPGHSAGSQIVFVKLKNGTEYLFVGDIAWSMENIRKLKGKPPLMNMLFLKEDRPHVASQLRALYDLTQTEGPNLHIIVAHDKEQLREYISQGLIVEGFL